jgi:hypothetical protein
MSLGGEKHSKNKGHAICGATSVFSLEHRQCEDKQTNRQTASGVRSGNKCETELPNSAVRQSDGQRHQLGA